MRTSDFCRCSFGPPDHFLEGSGRHSCLVLCKEHQITLYSRLPPFDQSAKFPSSSTKPRCVTMAVYQSIFATPATPHQSRKISGILIKSPAALPKALKVFLYPFAMGRRIGKLSGILNKIPLPPHKRRRTYCGKLFATFRQISKIPGILNKIPIQPHKRRRTYCWKLFATFRQISKIPGILNKIPIQPHKRRRTYCR